MLEFLDRYIQGERGSYFFCIEPAWGVQIAGGQFFYKQNARECLQDKLIHFLDGYDPDPSLQEKKRREARKIVDNIRVLADETEMKKRR